MMAYELLIGLRGECFYFLRGANRGAIILEGGVHV